MTTNQKPQPMTAAEQFAAEAETLRAAAAIMRRRFGGLGTPIAVLDEKARTLDFWAAEADVEDGKS